MPPISMTIMKVEDYVRQEIGNYTLAYILEGRSPIQQVEGLRSLLEGIITGSRERIDSGTSPLIKERDDACVRYFNVLLFAMQVREYSEHTEGDPFLVRSEKDE